MGETLKITVQYLSLNKSYVGKLGILLTLQAVSNTMWGVKAPPIPDSGVKDFVKKVAISLIPLYTFNESTKKDIEILTFSKN